MPVSRKDSRGAGSFAFPLFGVAILLASYWLLTGWQNVPAFINSALSAVQ